MKNSLPLPHELVVIGSTDCVDFPEFKLEDIPCKIDTGAAISALHCHDVQLREVDGETQITFQLLDPAHEAYRNETFHTANFKERVIKNSFGQSEVRYSIRTRVKLFNRTIKAEFTLSDREQMRYPVLLGKRLLKNKFLVDVSLNNLSHNLKNQSQQ